jgi:hypothetical protein
MVTVKLHAAVLPAASVAAQVTVVTPSVNVAPLAGVHATLTPAQLSSAVALNVTLLREGWPGSAFATMFAGQRMAGRSRSFTVTVKLQVVVLPAASVAAQLTVVTPRGKAEPLVGAHATLAPAQLSVTDGANTTTAPHAPCSVSTTTFSGHVTAGGCESRTVTVKEQSVSWPLASVAVQLTVVVPTPKAEPLEGLQVTLTPGQLSAASAEKFTAAPHWLTSALTTMSAGQFSEGLSRSSTVTSKEQLDVLPALSVAVQVTVVVPRGNTLPLAGTHATVAPGQLSVAPGSNAATAEHWPASVDTVRLAGQVTTGFSPSATTTRNEHEAVFPAGSVAVQVTVFDPVGKTEPAGGSHVTVTLEQLSLPVTTN